MNTQPVGVIRHSTVIEKVRKLRAEADELQEKMNAVANEDFATYKDYRLRYIEASSKISALLDVAINDSETMWERVGQS